MVSEVGGIRGGGGGQNLLTKIKFAVFSDIIFV